MDRLKRYISLNDRGTLKSDNTNDTMKLNRFLANPLNAVSYTHLYESRRKADWKA